MLRRSTDDKDSCRVQAVLIAAGPLARRAATGGRSGGTRNVLHSTRTNFSVNGFANGPFWLRTWVNDSVSWSSWYEYVTNTPGPITAGFFEAIGRTVMKLPGVTSYVPASATNGPHTARNSSALALATSARIGRGASACTSTRL